MGMDNTHTIKKVCSDSKATAQPMITSATLPRGANGDANEHTNSKHKHNENMYSRAGREGKQRLAGCQGTNYVVKPAFRYLNGDMRGVDCWSNHKQVFPSYYRLGVEYGISGAVIYTLNSKLQLH